MRCLKVLGEILNNLFRLPHAKPCREPITEAYEHIHEDWDPGEETFVGSQRDLESINTNMIADDTVFICPNCKVHSRLKNGKCIKCHYGFL